MEGGDRGMVRSSLCEMNGCYTSASITSVEERSLEGQTSRIDWVSERKQGNWFPKTACFICRLHILNVWCVTEVWRTTANHHARREVAV